MVKNPKMFLDNKNKSLLNRVKFLYQIKIKINLYKEDQYDYRINCIHKLNYVMFSVIIIY